MVDDSDREEGRIFVLILATSLCWSGQAGSGKRYKRLVYFAEKNKIAATTDDLLDKFDQRLRQLSVIDEQHRLHCEYAVTLRCHLFHPEQEPSTLSGSTTVGDDKPDRRPNLENVDKLSQCALIDALKVTYKLAPQTLSCRCVVDNRDGDKQQTTPLFFDEVVRLLQFYATIQPSASLIKILEAGTLFSYVRIIVMSEHDVLSLSHCLRGWIVPADLVKVSRPVASERSSMITDSVIEKSGQSMLPEPKPRQKVTPQAKSSLAIPVVIAHKKRKIDDGSARWYATDKEQLSVRGICAKLKSQLLEQTNRAE